MSDQDLYRTQFQAVQRRAAFQDILAEVSGRSADLLSFDEVRERLRLSEPGGEATMHEIRLDQIVGSVGRYKDFNRAFLPRGGIDPQRWAHIRELAGRGTLPPIDVFQVGEVYFVHDGHHRVSAARARKQRTILARVIEVPTCVPLEPGTSAEDMILKTEYADFLDRTALDRYCPDQHITLTRPGGYLGLLRHIEVHQFHEGLRSGHYPSLEEAADHWYRTVYLPVVERIRASGILERFPNRTEADLYLWFAENRAELQMRYSEQPLAHEAVDDFLSEQRMPRLHRWIRLLGSRMRPTRKRSPGS